MSEPVIPQSPELRERDARLRSLQRLAGRLAHDFNNYLSPIFGYLSLIKDETAADSQAYEYANTMERGVRRTTQLLESILLASRPERRFSPSSCQLDALVDTQLKAWQTSLPPYSQITVRASLEPCRIQADEALWREVLAQLLSNARYALSQGGELSITLATKDMTAIEALAIGVEPVPGVELTLQDNGPGMNEETLRHAIDPFYSTRPKNLALGLGLSIAYGVARLHGGQLLLQSQEGKGLRVTLWVPRIPAGLTVPLSSAGSNQLALQGPKILLVEPDPFAQETSVSALQKARYFVQIAAAADAALTLFEKRPKTYSLAILNAHLPEGSFELAQKLRLGKPDLPLLLVSGQAQTKQAMAKSGLAKPVGLLMRPFKPEALLAEALKLIPIPAASPESQA
jgi:CheY-like chemotaxis protein